MAKSIFDIFSIKKLKSVVKFIRLYGFKYFLEKAIRRLPRYFKKSIRVNKCIQDIVYKVRCEKDITIEDAHVDIVIPIYNGYDYVKTCVESVLANSKNCKLILIDDKSTDKQVIDYIKGLPDEYDKGIKIIKVFNKENLGYIKTINKAIRDYVENHFVLLNSDTEVPAGWLDRLFIDIISFDKMVASITPFSNASEISSFPEYCRDQPIFKGLGVNTIDKYFKIFGLSQLIETPTAVGFCMAVNKKAFDEIGFFDSGTFGSGYFEESDWSERAFKKGYSSFIAPNLYIYHKHGASFMEKKAGLVESNSLKMKSKHPDYLIKFDRFIEDDILKDSRDALSILIDANTRGNKRLIIKLDEHYFDKLNDFIKLKNHYEIIDKMNDCVIYLNLFKKQNLGQLIYEGDALQKEIYFNNMIVTPDILYEFIGFLNPDAFVYV
jgi:GT2 family glycosyltransferase